MREIKFYFTKDKTTGLYSEEIKDIFHSKTGALKEATEKFVNPVIKCKFFNNNKKLNILDICYGIGYNTKCAVNRFTDKEVSIDLLEYNKALILLSPFIKDGINDNGLKVNLIYNLLEVGIFPDEILSVLREHATNGNEVFFDKELSGFIEYLFSTGYKYTPSLNELSNLHNIYYGYVSNYTNNVIKTNYNKKFNFRLFTGDARKNILCLKDKKYDIVFLDAFSPQKDPTLWSIDFLKEVSKKLKEDSILLSYSKSAPFRSALLNLGFNVGKTLIDDLDFGTAASFNKENIFVPLSDFDTGLLNTRAGIVYKDPCLNSDKDLILKNRDFEIKHSSLMSHTQYLKLHS